MYLSAVRSLHIDNGLPDPLFNCLQLQRELKGIKRVQGASPTKRLPITIDVMRVLQRFFLPDGALLPADEQSLM